MVRLPISGDYEYIVEETIYDAAYGNKPRSYRSQGSFIYEPGNKKWIFKGGDWGERGAHINVPYDGWENEPKQLTVFFPVNRGRPTLFERNSN